MRASFDKTVGSANETDTKTLDGTNLSMRDPEYIRRQMPFIEVFSRWYFRVRVSGMENTPARGPVIFVSNHSGGITTPDSILLAHAFWSRFGPERPVYTLSQREAFGSENSREHLVKIGAVAATASVASKVLRSGASMLVYPGGGHEAYRPSTKRNEVDLNGNSAFIKLAIRFGVPIVPVACMGGHDGLVVLDDGRATAQFLGLDRLGIERLPLTVSFPYGLALGLHHYLPPPMRIDIMCGRPIHFSGFAKKDVRDGEVIKFCFDHVEQVMQNMLGQLVASRTHESSVSQ